MLNASSLWAIALKILGIYFVVIGVAGLLPQWFQMFVVQISDDQTYQRLGGMVSIILLPLLQYGIYIAAGVALFIAADQQWLRVSGHLDRLFSASGHDDSEPSDADPTL